MLSIAVVTFGQTLVMTAEAQQLRDWIFNYALSLQHHEVVCCINVDPGIFDRVARLMLVRVG